MSNNAIKWYESTFYRTKYIAKPRSVNGVVQRFERYNSKQRQVSWRFAPEKMNEYLDWIREVQGQSFEAICDDEFPATWEVHVADDDFWTCGNQLMDCLFITKQVSCWDVPLRLRG